MPRNWPTVSLLVGLFVAVILLVEPLGWAITGTLLFAGTATIFRQLHHYVRNIGVIGAVLAVASFYAFYGAWNPAACRIRDGIL